MGSSVGAHGALRVGGGDDPIVAGREEVFDTLRYGVLSLSLAVAGALIVRQHPRNPVGWLFCVLAAYGASAELAEGWGLLAAERGLPGRAAGEWVITWSWIGDIAVWTVVLVLFPNGMPSGRWPRVTIWMAVLGAVLSLPGQALSTRSDDLFSDGRNPFAIEGALLPLLFWAGMALLLTALLTAVVGFVVRMRRARGVERQQLTWFAYAAVMVGATMPVAVIFWDRSVLVQSAVALAFAALPCAAVIAILRYRLYSIDRIINRTVVYGLLSAALGLTYAVVILLVGQLPGGERSSLAVAAATLAAAGLVQPARRRIQLAVGPTVQPPALRHRHDHPVLRRPPPRRDRPRHPGGGLAGSHRGDAAARQSLLLATTPKRDVIPDSAWA